MFGFTTGLFCDCRSTQMDISCSGEERADSTQAHFLHLHWILWLLHSGQTMI